MSELFIFLFILFVLSPLTLLFIYKFHNKIYFVYNAKFLGKKYSSLDGLSRLYQKKAEATFQYGKEGEEVFIRNIRNATYKSSEWDNVVDWQNKKYILSKILPLKIVISHYALLQTHIILKFYFENNSNPLCVSYEIKKDDSAHPENFKAYKAIYHIFHGFYLLGTEADIIGVRKNVRHEKHLEEFETNFTREDSLLILKSILEDVNKYYTKARYYNFIYRNCLTEVFKHFAKTGKFNYSYLSLFHVKSLLLKNKTIVYFNTDETKLSGNKAENKNSEEKSK